MTSSPNPLGSRLCPACGAAEPIESHGPLWPAGWRCNVCGHSVPIVDDIPQYAPALADSMVGFNPAGFSELARRETGHFWFEPRNRLLVNLANRYFPKATRYLEVGCGTGAVLAPMAESRPWATVVGSEIH